MKLRIDKAKVWSRKNEKLPAGASPAARNFGQQRTIMKLLKKEGGRQMWANFVGGIGGYHPDWVHTNSLFSSYGECVKDIKCQLGLA